MPAKPTIPPLFDPDRVAEVRRVQYESVAQEARAWARDHDIEPASADRIGICLVAVDVQNTFCTPGFELYVGGRSGTGAVDDNRRLCAFVYRNLNAITRIVPTMDTHQAYQIFHSTFLADASGNPPPPHTVVSRADAERGRWHMAPDAAAAFGMTSAEGDQYLRYYTSQLAARGKYELTVWPFHAMLGGIGHALVPAFEEAVFFHTIARRSQPVFHVKGRHPLTEHYSVLGPEVRQDAGGNTLSTPEDSLLPTLMAFDAVVIAGQAKSHCVAWTIDDLLSEVRQTDPSLVEKVYLLADCTSPVVVPGIMDYTEQADEAFRRFERAGMHVVRSTDPIAEWPGLRGLETTDGP